VAAANLIADRIHDSTTATLEIIKAELNDKGKMMYSKKEDWEWQEGNGQFSTQANVYEYQLDNSATGIGVSDLRRFLGNQRIEANDQEIRPITIETYTRRFTDSDSDTGLPTAYTTWNDKLILAPVPDAVYVVDFRYYKAWTDLTDNQVPPWPTDFNWIWLVGAEAQMLDYNSNTTAARKWGSFLGGMREMIGDSETLDEEIRCQPFSGNHPVIVERNFPPHRF
jgi:hypothetical protein